MAGDWIKMRINLADDPAVIAMAASLDSDEFSIVGRLHKLWGWADSQSRDGHASGVTRKWIDRCVQRDGFADAMVSVGWLELSDTGIRFPNFDRHNGETAKQRGLATARKKAQRENVTQDVTDMSRNERDKSVTREEKRRDIKEKKGAIALPDWLDKQAWADWHTYRNSRKGWTPKARELSLATLSKLRDLGHNPKAIIERSIERGWTGLFEPDTKPQLKLSGSHRPAVIEKRERVSSETGLKRLSELMPNL